MRRFAVAVVTLGMLATGLAIDEAGVASARPAVHSDSVVVRADGADWEWLIRPAGSGGSATTSFIYGKTTDRPIWGDWNGDGVYSPGVVRADGSHWEWLLRDTDTGGSATTSFLYGLTSDTPITGDWDGNGTFTPAVARPDGTHWEWLERSTNTGGSATTSFLYGLTSDTPIAGDWDGNGTFTPGVTRPDGRNWEWLLRSSNSGGSATTSFLYGLVTDTPIAGDWDGNGTTTAGVLRSDGAHWNWLLRDTNTGGSATTSYGYALASDRPVGPTQVVSSGSGGTGVPSSVTWAVSHNHEVYGTPSEQPNTSAHQWSGFCWTFVYDAFGHGVPIEPTAQAAYNYYNNRGKVHSGIPPAGTIAFYSYGSAGHAAVAVGGGNIIGTYGTESQREQTNEVAYNARGLPYLGWVSP